MGAWAPRHRAAPSTQGRRRVVSSCSRGQKGGWRRSVICGCEAATITFTVWRMGRAACLKHWRSRQTCSPGGVLGGHDGAQSSLRTEMLRCVDWAVLLLVGERDSLTELREERNCSSRPRMCELRTPLPARSSVRRKLGLGSERRAVYFVANGPTTAEIDSLRIDGQQAGSCAGLRAAKCQQAGFCELAGEGCGVEGKWVWGTAVGTWKVSRLQSAACCDAGIDEASGSHARRGGGAPWSVEHGRG